MTRLRIDGWEPLELVPTDGDPVILVEKVGPVYAFSITDTVRPGARIEVLERFVASVRLLWPERR